MPKLLFLIIVVLIISFSFFIIKNFFQVNIAKGYVYDCQTHQPISDVEVSLNNRGWGLYNNQLIWDKDYSYKAATNNDGSFRIAYKGTPTDIQAKKQGYYLAQKYDYPNQNIKLELLSGNNASEVTYNCKLSFECIKKEIINGVETSRDVCADQVR